ncbi:MAG: MATE family efflux transporter [Bacillota bacterium]|nr:MATE family efflux transporter [Bacillota bacterium]
MKGKLDMTQGVGWRHVLIFSLPIMLGNLLQQLYNTVDGIVVGKYVSEAALGAVGNCASLTFLFIAIAFGLSNGSGIVVAQFFGAKREDDVRRAASTAILLLCGVGIAGVVFGLAGSQWLLGTVLGIKDEEVLKEAVTYFRIYSAGLLFQFLYNVVAALLRALGDSKATLYFLIISTAINLGLDLLFVLSFSWGVAGVAAATVIAQCISTVFSLVYMNRRYPVFRFKLKELKYHRDMGKRCLQMGIPSMLQQSVVAIGSMFMQRLVNTFGKALMAAFTVGNRVENYIFIPIMALNAGMSTFAGQNMGAGKPRRVKECWKRVMVMSLAFSAFIAVLIYSFATPISTLFGVTGKSLTMSVEMIRFMSFFVLLFSLYLPTGGLLQGAGDAFFAMLCSMSTLGVRVISAYTMVYAFDVDYHAVWYAVPIGWVCCVILSWARYFSGAWERKALVKKA